MNAHTNIPAPTHEEIVTPREDFSTPEQRAENDTTASEAAPSESAADEQPSVAPVAPAVPTETIPTALSLPDGYTQFADGIYASSDDETAVPVFVCTPLRVEATFADMHGRGWGRLVSVKSGNGQWHEIPITSADLQRKPADVIARLVDHGLELSTEKKSKDLLLDLLKTWKPDQHLKTVSRMGWSDETHTSFVRGSTLIGSAQVLPLAPASGIGAGLVEAGSVASWKADIGARCSGNSQMVMAVSLAFSGPLLAPLGMAGGGLHFRGASSSGKTTLLNIAASVWGDRRLITPWRATSNGLEGV